MNMIICDGRLGGFTIAILALAARKYCKIKDWYPQYQRLLVDGQVIINYGRPLLNKVILDLENGRQQYSSTWWMIDRGEF